MTTRRTLLLLLLLPTALLGQGLAQWIAWGDAAVARGDQYGASRFYGEALKREPGRMVLQWKQAEACRLSDQYPEAAALYDRVYRKDMGRQYPDALRWLGEMQLCAGDHAAALATWRKVLQKEKDKGSRTAERAANAIRGCALADSLARSAPTIIVEHLPEPLNSFASEFAARPDSTGALVLSSLRGELADDNTVVDTNAYHVAIYRSAPAGEAWSRPGHYPDSVPGEDRANGSWSLDGRRFHFTRCVNGECGIVVQDLATGEVRPLEGLGDGHHTQPMVASVDGVERLFLTSDRAGGVGGMDLWWGRLEGGMVKDLYPVPGAVNTLGNETCPHFDTASGTLSFSSDHLPGLGGYDIFTSTRQDDVFGAPVHAGVPMNSPANDLYPVMDGRTGVGYLTSNRVGSLAKKGETCCSDIYRVRLPAPLVAQEPPPPADTVRSTRQRLADLRSKLPVRLYFHNDEPDPRSWRKTTDRSYPATFADYEALLPRYRAELRNPTATAGFERFFIEEVRKGLDDLNAAAVVLREAMEQGQRIELVVRGFASPLAKSDYNANLSLRRIQSVVNHLRSIDGGFFVPFLDGTAPNGGLLTITPAPFGEEKAASGVSDALGDVQRSVYSVEAARERRIEIEQLLEVPAEGVTVQVDRTLVDLGRIPIGAEQQLRFHLHNRGTRPLRLIEVESDCGCTTAKPSADLIAPGGSTALDVIFNGRAQEGAMMRRVRVLTDGEPSEIFLTITGTMVPD
ncbi:MAG: DUF1573 domain-containing protein [Flavobacteriales bacterium]|nr:DUF1573 domain-containing protein [Flavobacteriales bacterium]